MEEKIKKDEINKEEFQKIMADMIEGYEKLENKQDLDSYLQEKLKEYEVGESEEERKSVVSKFSITLNGIAKKFKDLISFKKKGKRGGKWLEQDLAKSMEGLEESDKSIIMESIDKSLKEERDNHKKAIKEVIENKKK